MFAPAFPPGTRFRWFLPGAPILVSPPRRFRWREAVAGWLIHLAKQLVGFDSTEAFERARQTILRSERDVGSNRVSREGATVRSGPNFFIGKSSGAIAKGATNGSVIVWDGATAGALAATSVTLTNVYLPWAAVADAKWVLVLQYEGFYLVVCGEC